MDRQLKSQQPQPEEIRLEDVYEHVRKLLLAGARSPGVELTPAEWQVMRREADAALRARTQK